MKYSVDFAKTLAETYIQVKTISHIGSGNHSDAFLLNDKYVIKIPKHKTASDCLKKEIKVLKGIEGKITLNIPNVLYSGTFVFYNQEFTFFISSLIKGKKLSKTEFVDLSEQCKDINATKLANFLIELHRQKSILNIKRKDLCLLHGDFSLGHCLFGEDNIVCGVLDFGDSRSGKPQSDFIYLLDDEDDEEFGIKFGNKVLELYNKLKVKNEDII